MTLTIDRKCFCSVVLPFVILFLMLQYSVIQFQLFYDVKLVFDAPLVVEKRGKFIFIQFDPYSLVKLKVIQKLNMLHFFTFCRV